MDTEWNWSVSTCPAVLEILNTSECLQALQEVKIIIPDATRGVYDATPAKRMQVTRWSEKTILDKTLPMAQYLQEAILLHPRVVSGKGMGSVLRAVVRAVSGLGEGVISWRARQEFEIKRIAKSLEGANKALLQLVPTHGQGITRSFNYALLYVVCEAIGYVDRTVVDAMLYGFMPVGDVPAGGRFRPVDEPEVAPFTAEENSKLFDDVSAVLSESARKARRQGEKSKAWGNLETLWDNVVGEGGEISKGLMDGGDGGDGYTRRQIWDKYKHCLGGPRCLLRFGVEQNDKLRGCDNGAFCGHNFRTRMHETIHCLGADFPALLAREFAKFCPNETCRIGTDDVEAAYRKVLNSMPQYTVVALWDPKRMEVRYFTMPGFPFGLRSAVVAFNRVEEFVIEVARVLLLVACGHYYDDAATVEPKFAGTSGQRAVWFVHQILGLPFADKKHEKMRAANPFLGIVSDFAKRPGFVILRVKETRRRKVLALLQRVLDERVLTGAGAASLRGKLYFTSLTAFGGVGRAPLQVLASRQYGGNGDVEVDDGMEDAIKSMMGLLKRLPPRTMPLVDAGREDCIYIWSDAMWEPITDDMGEAVQVFDEVTGARFYIASATLAFAIYRPWANKWTHSYFDVGIETIRQMVPGKKTYIGQLEALAAAAVVHTLPVDWLRGRDGYMWVDNMGAKYSLQKGSARKEDSARIVDSFAKRVASLGFRPWLEYVPSKQNLADLPSRGRWAEYYEAIGADVNGKFPSGDVASEFMTMVVPDVSGWSTIDEAAGPSKSRKRRRRRR